MEASQSDSAFQGILRKIDTYSMPFQFSLYGLEKTKRTFVGGFFTLIVYSLSIAYFIYITNLYFTTGYQPKVSTIDLSQNNDSFQVANDSFAFNFFLQGQGNIQQYEQQTGKKYFSFLIYYQYYDNNQNLKTTTLNTIKCSDTSLQDYLCIDFSSLPSQVTLKYNQNYSSLNQEGFQIIFLQCNGDQSCASDEDIVNVLFNAYNSIKFSSKLERFNTISQNVETVRQINSYILDQYVGTRHQVHLIQSKTTLIEGFILQKRSINNYLDSFEEIQEIKWIQTLQKQVKLPIIGEIIISMSTKQRFITIQYPLFTETFAQFMSVFALLTILGNIAIKAYQQFIAPKESQIDKELQNLENQTREFYKDIIQIKKIIRLLLSKEQFSAIKYCGLDIQKSKEQQNEQFALGQQNKIDTKIEFNIEKRNNETQQTHLKLNQVELQIDQTKEKNSVNNNLIQNDVKEEALASNSNQSKTNCLNHLELIEKIDHNNELAEQYFINYLQQINQKENISDLDQRILNCLIKTEDEEYLYQESNQQQQ
ncbi:kinase domain protein (macronuclear) [Tetrahymena thermophila SB210]|uniref:Kinase domain protein n=1 Tax=Tetrahymena thermophila (strain SB210) TaxID=312017 RepID=W7XFQ2_TETTS|nr:kinase domain protein [Tetrahymena thermophila SB210]EWS75688.1 kinase domain protein [Tetrahymena thermophila SB210]|eukprot:XP_012651761.1 kinase domain protein [Tetrahymena thermophila SB210]